MTLKEQISTDLITAMKNKNSTALKVLRVLKAEIEREEQSDSGKIELSDGQIIGMVKKFIDGVNQTTKDQSEIDVMIKYLPQQLLEAEIRTEVLKIKENNNLSGIKDMGKIMSHFKSNYEGRYDGKILSVIAKEVL
jgi:uncharacterized protein YqeY